MNEKGWPSATGESGSYRLPERSVWDIVDDMDDLGAITMRRNAKVDDNQRQIVEWLRRAGATVQSLAMVGKGCPDIVVGYRGQNYLMEIKDGNKPPSARRLTTDEEHWHDSWAGTVHVVEHPESALLIIGATNTLDNRSVLP